MTTDAAQTEPQEAPQPQYISVEDFRRFQSQADRRAQEEARLADEAFSRVAELEEQLQRLQERAVEDDDPRVVELNKRLNAAEKRAREAESLVKRFSPAYKRALVEKEALKLSRGDEAMAEQLQPFLARGRTEAEVLQIAQDIRARGFGPAPQVPHPRSAPEVDTGRGSGRGGAPRVTREWIAQGTAQNPRFYSENKDAIEAALRKGPIPER